MQENDSLELIQLPDTLKFFKHSFQSIEIDEDEIILINIQIHLMNYTFKINLII
jgi:hypothetical protein